MWVPMRESLRCALLAVLVAALVRPGAGSAAPRWVDQVLQATGGPRLMVLVVPLDSGARKEASLLEHSAELVASRSSRVTLVPAQDAFDPSAAQARQAALELGRKRLKEGRSALDDLDPPKATEAFVAAREALKQADPTTASAELLDAWMLKAASHATGGENAAARKELEALLAIDPKAEVSSAHFPPDLMKYAEAQRRLATTAKGELVVHTTPEGARIWVDGTYRGRSPLTVAGLTSARHSVAGVLSGFALAQTELPPGDAALTLSPAELAAPLQKAIGQVASDSAGPGRDRAAMTLGQQAKVDQVLVVLARKSTTGEQLELVLIRLETRDGHNAAYREATVPIGNSERLEAALEPLFAKDAPRDGKDPVSHVQGGGLPQRKVIGLSLAGAGVAVAVVGGVFGFMALDREQAYRDTRQLEVTRSLQLKTQGQSFAVVADVSFLVALAAGATGGVLYFTRPPETQPAAPAPSPSPTPARATAPTNSPPPERKAQEPSNPPPAQTAQPAPPPKEQPAASPTPAPAEQKPAPASSAHEDTARPREEPHPEDKKAHGKKALAEKKAEEAAKKKAEDEAKARADEEARQKAEADRKRIEDDKKREAEKKKKPADDHDDLRNY